MLKVFQALIGSQQILLVLLESIWISTKFTMIFILSSSSAPASFFGTFQKIPLIEMCMNERTCVRGLKNVRTLRKLYECAQERNEA